MFEPLKSTAKIIIRCPEPDCPWTSKPKHKRPKMALALHRKEHESGVTFPTVPILLQGHDDVIAGFLVTFLTGEELHVPAEEHQETMDRHWFFRGGALKETFKRKDVAAVEVA
jgi:hypothetical protein